MGLLFRSRLVAFDTKEAMTASADPIVRQFLSGQAAGPIGMDEMAESDDEPGASPSMWTAHPDSSTPHGVDIDVAVGAR